MNFNYLLAAEQLTVTANPLLPEASWFTNSMLVTVIVTGLVLLWARRSTKKMTLIPEGAQNLFEALIETLYLTFEGIVGKHMIPKVFSLFATLFIFILAANWFGLVPGVGSIGFGETGGGPLGLKEVNYPLLRPANADLNMTLGMALVFHGLVGVVDNPGSWRPRIPEKHLRSQGRFEGSSLVCAASAVFVCWCH